MCGFMTIYMFSGLLVFMGLLSFILNYSHLLNSLLSLEMISVSLYIMLGLNFVFFGKELFYLLYFLVMAVCEGVLGLSLLVAVTYGFGGDYFKSIGVLLC